MQNLIYQEHANFHRLAPGLSPIWFNLKHSNPHDNHFLTNSSNNDDDDNNDNDHNNNNNGNNDDDDINNSNNNNDDNITTTTTTGFKSILQHLIQFLLIIN